MADTLSDPGARRAPSRARASSHEKRKRSMSITDEMTDQQGEIEAPIEARSAEPAILLDLDLSEAEALRAWLLKPANDGSTSLDDPLVSHVLSKLGREVDAVTATVNVRRELIEAGVSVDHLDEEQMRDLARRIAQAARPSARG
jgi:hypothetical protein